MKSLVEYFGCGRYVPRKDRDLGDFECTKFSDINEKLIPYFDRYPLLGNKALDFEDFKCVVELMKSKAHLSVEGLEQIRKIKAGMNRGRCN